MKKTLIALFLVLSVVSHFSIARAADSCDAITASNYDACCSNDADTTHQAQCDAYDKQQGAATSTSAAPTADACSTITDANYNQCCSNDADDSHATQCKAFDTRVSGANDPNAVWNSASCKDITSDYQFKVCCSSVTTSQCAAYEKNNSSVETPTTAIQQVGGTTAAPTTNSVSTGNISLSGTGNPNASTSAGDQAAVATCTAIKFTNLLNIAIWAKCLIGAIVIPGIFTLAFVVFLWGVFKFIRASEQKDKDEGKQFIYMGIIGLFVMVSVWGIIRILNTTLGIDSTVPTLQTTYLSTQNVTK